MAELDLTPEIRELRSTFSDILHVVDRDALDASIAELKTKAAEPNLWDDPATAQKVTSALSHKQSMADKLANNDRYPYLPAPFCFWKMTFDR